MDAYETQLEFSGVSGRAVVVDCGLPWRFVFWDKAQYVGCIDVGAGTWFTSEWCETNSPNDYHCYEAIMDKQLRWAYAELLEAGPARCRVKYKYRLGDMRYRVFHGNTRAEEIYTVYPDGVALREVVLWPGTENNHGGNANFWQQAEWILINAAGTSPLDVLQMPEPFTLTDGGDGAVAVPWPLPADWFMPFCERYPQIASWPRYIGQVHLKDRPSPWVAIFKDQALYPHMPCSACGGDHPYMNLFPGKDLINVYKHWPVTTMEDFIQWVPAGSDAGKVATHTSFVDVNFAMRRKPSDYVPTPDQGTTWYLLQGATLPGTSPYTPEEIALSYHRPAQVEIQRDADDANEMHRGRVLAEGYDWSLRAYTFRKRGEDRVEFALHPSEPQINPVFVINGWEGAEAAVLIDGREAGHDDYRVQLSGADLVIWVRGRFTDPTHFKIVG